MKTRKLLCKFMIDFKKCFIMLCDSRTEEECLRRNLFGDKANKLQDLSEVKPGDVGLLLNIDRDELLGLFRACFEPKLHIKPDAWNGRFAAQVSVEPMGELQRIKDATYVLQKAGIRMRQLRSGALAPQFPVYERDIGEKILAHFGEHIK